MIFLLLLSGWHAFFHANDDLTALAQVVSISGSEAVKNACGMSCVKFTLYITIKSIAKCFHQSLYSLEKLT